MNSCLDAAEQAKSSMAYWPSHLEERFTAEATDHQPALGTCKLTVNWTETGASGTLHVPSGATLIDTQCDLKKELEEKLADSVWVGEMAKMNDLKRDAFYKALWHKYRDATIGKVIMDVSVLKEDQKEIIQVTLPSGYNRVPKTLAKHFGIWLAAKGYKLESVEDFMNAYYNAVTDQREMYSRSNPIRLDVLEIDIDPAA